MRNQNLDISISDARQNNLKNVSLEIPHYKLIAVTGISGSGKSSLAFDTIAAEGKRQFLESIPSFARQYAGKTSKSDIEKIEGLFPVITVGQKISGSSSKSTVGTLSEIYDYLRLLFARFGQHPDGIKLSRSLFSFNSSMGACPTCHGLGKEEKISLNKLVADPNKTLREGALVPTLPNGYIMYSQVTVDVLNTVCEQHGFNVDIPWKELSEEQKDVILNGSERIKVLYGKHSLESRLKWKALKAKPREEGYYKGMLPIMEDILRRDRNKNILRFVEAVTCFSCNGKRLNKDALSVIYHHKSIDYLSDLELSELLDFFNNIQSQNEAENKILQKLIQQLETLCNLGVSYLQLSRETSSLTSGEIQRIRLVNQLGADLSNVLYIFDEPSIGMHPRHNKYMISLLKKLVKKGNTVIIVEHDLETIRQSDWIIEIGPEAGINGGELLFNGTKEAYIEDEKKIELTYTQRALISQDRTESSNEFLKEYLLEHCNLNNLKDLSVKFKNNALNAVTGVPGSGKSSLINGCLIPTLEHVIKVDQKPIGRTPRSNPATYTGLADHIRDLFANQPEAKNLGFKKGRFSFNNKGGRCETCEGAGKTQIGIHYMGNVDIVCDTCNGKRFNDETLFVKYKQKSISDIYELSINQAYEFFAEEAKILKYLEILKTLGLGYLKLGQSSTTLSGGEAQRIKLATELVKKQRENTWYVLEEPSTGLHYYDTIRLIDALRKLAKQGNTIVYIEYQEQLIQAADWIIELGPESGKNGGEIVFQGTWEAFKESNTITSKAIQEELKEKDLEETSNSIEIYNAQTNNLKGIDVQFPKNKTTVITGLSGSGKSSLAFDTLFAESQTRFYESLSTYAKSFIKQSNLAKADRFENLTPVISISRKNLPESPRSTVGTLTEIYEKYRFMYSRIAYLEGKEIPAKSFSFNHESGACQKCSGLGFVKTADPQKIAIDWNLSIMEGAFNHNATVGYYGNPDSQFMAILREVSKELQINLNKKLIDFTEKELDIILYGTGDRKWTTTWNFKTKTDAGQKEITGIWKGICKLIDEEYNRSLHNKTLHKLEALMHNVQCNSCKGSRLNDKALAIKINDKNIYELSSLSINETINWFENLETNKSEKAIINQIYDLLQPQLITLQELGLGHLSISRTSSTLSGGEGQRLQLAKHLHGNLTGITFVLDEPTIGLHESNVNQLLRYISKLKEKGNTVVIVEHDKQVIKSADYIIEIGPESGKRGGEIIAYGELDQFKKSNKAITPPYLFNENFPVSKKRKIHKNSFGVIGVNKHNLINQDFHFHSNGIIALTGVSGAGKTTLLKHILLPTLQQQKAINCKSFYVDQSFDEVIHIDQKSFVGSKLSSVSSAIGILPQLQYFFANTDDAKTLKLKKNAFSYQHKDGRCSHCNGQGQIKISMDFMEDVWNICEECDGKRFKEKILSVKLLGHSIFDVLNKSIKETWDFLNKINDKTVKKLQVILEQFIEVGLGHLQLIQTTGSLSGGEAQRLKLMLQLLESRNRNTLFLIDEPSSGLHYKDLDDLINIFNRIADQGNTIIFIEHNPYLISIANQKIEL